MILKLWKSQAESLRTALLKRQDANSATCERYNDGFKVDIPTILHMVSAKTLRGYKCPLSLIAASDQSLAQKLVFF